MVLRKKCLKRHLAAALDATTLQAIHATRKKKTNSR